MWTPLVGRIRGSLTVSPSPLTVSDQGPVALTATVAVTSASSPES